MGYTCNLRCTHCHVDASPERREAISEQAVETILNILKSNHKITSLIITGGAPELNPHFKYFVEAAVETGVSVIVCSNLSVFSEEGMKDIPQFLAEKKVKIITSLPGCEQEQVDSQRGKGTFEKIIFWLEHLNGLGYGLNDDGLKIDVLYNPPGVSIAPDSGSLECDYKKKLKDRHGVTFNQLITFSNMPIGRLGKSMKDYQVREFTDLLESRFNAATVESLMCRHHINISPDGRLFDCGFAQSLNKPVTVPGATIDEFDYAALSRREINTSDMCLLCTATAGTTCRCCLK